jgi:hypothetical protein
MLLVEGLRLTPQCLRPVTVAFRLCRTRSCNKRRDPVDSTFGFLGSVGA